MTRERIIHFFAGTMVLASVSLGYFLRQPGWFILTAFVGANLLQSSFTRWCLLDDILRKAGVPGEAGASCCTPERRAR